MSYFIDTHTHLFATEFDNDIDSVINQSKNNNINKFIIPNIDSSSIDSMINLAEKYPDCCFPTIGLHPTSVKEDYQKELTIVEEWLAKYKFYALGEMGIDLYWDKTYKEQQIEVFKIHLKYAEKYNLPLIIHSRKSIDEIIILLQNYSYPDMKGVFHCFPGNLVQAIKVIEMGFVLGIGGVVTYPNAGLAEVVEKINLDKIVLETDSPYLTPVPNRGKRNDSSNIIYIAKKIAEIKNIHLDEVAETTTNTAQEIFNI